jgi:hypothetical protein
MTRDRKRELKESQNYEFFVDADERTVAEIEASLKVWIIGRLIKVRAKRIFRNLKNSIWGQA